MKRPGRGRFCSQPCRGIGLTIPIEERFQKYIGEPRESGCIPWIGCTNADGYGIIDESTAQGKTWLAHRYAFIRGGGVLEEEQCVLHHCDNPPCVNFGHLYAGDRQNNADDRIARGRSNKGEKHGLSKLHDVDIPVIRQLIADGVPYGTISDYFNGLSAAAISNIKTGKRWGHIV